MLFTFSCGSAVLGLSCGLFIQVIIIDYILFANTL
jgi:hypothetical protein